MVAGWSTSAMAFMSAPVFVGFENAIVALAPNGVKSSAALCRSTVGVPAGYGADCRVPVLNVPSSTGADSQSQRVPSGDRFQLRVLVATVLRLVPSPMSCVFSVSPSPAALAFTDHRTDNESGEKPIPLEPTPSGSTAARLPPAWVAMLPAYASSPVPSASRLMQIAVVTSSGLPSQCAGWVELTPISMRPAVQPGRHA